MSMKPGGLLAHLQIQGIVPRFRPMHWHIINHRDYIDGPFDTFEMAFREAQALGNESRKEPRISRRAKDFFVYRPPYDRNEHWQPEYWICTEEAAIAAGVSAQIFEQPMSDRWALLTEPAGSVRS